MGQMMVLLGRVMVCFHKLSVQTAVVSAPDASFVWGLWDPHLGERVVVGSWRYVRSSLVVSSYWLPIVTLGLSLTVVAVLWFVMDRRNWSNKSWHSLCTKVHQAPKINKSVRNESTMLNYHRVVCSCIVAIHRWTLHASVLKVLSAQELRSTIVT